MWKDSIIEKDFEIKAADIAIEATTPADLSDTAISGIAISGVAASGSLDLQIWEIVKL